MTTLSINAARVELMLTALWLPGMKAVWAKLADKSDKEGWPATRFLSVLAEHEVIDRDRHLIERHLAEARLPAGKTPATFDFESVPMVSKAQIMALAADDAWLKKGASVLLFGPPGGGKSHLSAALGIALIETVGASCSRAPLISCSGCKWPVASSDWKVRLPGSTATICRFSTISPTSARIRRRLASCSSCSPRDTNGARSLSPPTSRSASRAASSPTTL